MLKVGLARAGAYLCVRRSVVLILISWLPLLFFSAIEGTAWSDRVGVPFVLDFAAHARFLVALPLLVFAQRIVDGRLQDAAEVFISRGLIKEADLPAYEATARGVLRLRDSLLPDFLMLAAAFLPLLIQPEPVYLTNVTTWRTVMAPAADSRSVAGWSFDFVSLPLYRFMLLRWTWWILLWTLFLSRIMRIDLQCVATHPDQMAGLRFLTGVQRQFTVVAYAIGVAVSGVVANAILYAGMSIEDLKTSLIAYGLLMLFLVTLPVYSVTPKLMRIKRKGMRDYGALSHSYVREFHAKWIQGPPPNDEKLLGSADVQSLADMGSSYGIISDMYVVPIDMRTLAYLALPAALPALVAALCSLPLNEIVRSVIGLLV
jgi:hypothetical protein